MRCLVVYAHPVESSYCAALKDRAVGALRRGGHDVRVVDLYGEGFEAALTRQERIDYHSAELNTRNVTAHVAAIGWAEALVFVYPTWWYGLPAILKGWLDRVWVPGVAFALPQSSAPIRGLMDNIVRIVGITTSGSTRIWLLMIGNPGRRTIARGIRALCPRRCRTTWLQHYDIDRSTPQSRAAFLERVDRALSRL
jgi:putative NADPH-quinone reductase